MPATVRRRQPKPLKFKMPPCANGTALSDEACVAVPPHAFSLAGFRRWSHSPTFPEGGKITFAGGEIIIDMSPENLDTHGVIKAEIVYVVMQVVREADLGRLYIDRARFVHKKANVSNEPDALLVTWAARAAKRIRKVPARRGKGAIEFEGTPDWVLEIVSDSSVKKDTVVLPERYHLAGVPEYWLVDARGDEAVLFIFYHGPDGYEAAPTRGGWQKSRVLRKQFRLVTEKDRLDEPAFRLEVK